MLFKVIQELLQLFEFFRFSACYDTGFQIVNVDVRCGILKMIGDFFLILLIQCLSVSGITDDAQYDTQYHHEQNASDDEAAFDWSFDSAFHSNSTSFSANSNKKSIKNIEIVSIIYKPYLII